MICTNCGKQYEVKYRYSKEYLATRKFCSRECYRTGAESDPTKFQKGHKPLIDQLAEKNNQWKGDKVGYSGIHKWVSKLLGKPKECKLCGTTQKKWYDWANISHEYKRDINDWMRLCRSCHTKYDRSSKIVGINK